jgi:hypothetical protein
MLLQHWGASEAEIAGAVVGDDILTEPRLVATRAVDLDAAPDRVWPWLVQMGTGRAGWYSYDWLDNFGRKSARRIHPEWQHLVAGSAVPAGPIAFRSTIVDAPHALVLELRSAGSIGRRVSFTLAYDLRRASGGGTRLVTRVRGTVDLPLGRLVERWLLGPGDGVMLRRQLLNLRQRTA